MSKLTLLRSGTSIMFKVAVLLACGLAQPAFAYSGAGAECVNLPETPIGRAILQGAADDLPSLLDAQVDSKWLVVHREIRKALEDYPEAYRHWREEAKAEVLNAGWGCFQLGLLDLAVANGRVEAVKWLLQEGADPSGDRGGHPDAIRTVFARCGQFAQDKTATAGLSREELIRRVRQAFAVLIESGGDINRTVSIAGRTASYRTLCREPAMIELLDALGVGIPPRPRPQNPYDSSKPQEVRNALERDVFIGRLRRANAKDFISWMYAYLERPWYRSAQKMRVPDFWNAYVVLERWYPFPPGLHGDQTHIFFVPPPRDAREGQERIKNAGASTIYYLYDGTCSGPRC